MSVVSVRFTCNLNAVYYMKCYCICELQILHIVSTEVRIRYKSHVKPKPKTNKKQKPSEANGQKPKANGQKPKANGQKPKANGQSQKPKAKGAWDFSSKMQQIARKAARRLKKKKTIYIYNIYIYIYLSVYLSTYLPSYLYIYLSIYLSNNKQSKSKYTILIKIEVTNLK